MVLRSFSFFSPILLQKLFMTTTWTHWFGPSYCSLCLMNVLRAVKSSAICIFQRIFSHNIFTECWIWFYELVVLFLPSYLSSCLSQLTVKCLAQDNVFASSWLPPCGHSCHSHGGLMASVVQAGRHFHVCGLQVLLMITSIQSSFFFLYTANIFWLIYKSYIYIAMQRFYSA